LAGVAEMAGMRELSQIEIAALILSVVIAAGVPWMSGVRPIGHRG
jgi:hypothetical protein